MCATTRRAACSGTSGPPRWRPRPPSPSSTRWKWALTHRPAGCPPCSPSCRRCRTTRLCSPRRLATPAVTEARVQRALAQFQRAMVATSSRWDAGTRPTTTRHCPTMGWARRLPASPRKKSAGGSCSSWGGGRAGWPARPATSHPRLRWLPIRAATGWTRARRRSSSRRHSRACRAAAPSCTTGGLPSLEQVVEHYNSGVQDGPALDNRLQAGNAPRRLNLTEADKAALVAFPAHAGRHRVGGGRRDSPARFSDAVSARPSGQVFDHQLAIFGGVGNARRGAALS
jgi:hypothetical protein